MDKCPLITWKAGDSPDALDAQIIGVEQWLERHNDLSEETLEAAVSILAAKQRSGVKIFER